MNRNVLLVAISFFFIFFGFNTAQQYFASIYAQQGIENIAMISLFILYFFFMVGSLLASIIVTRLSLRKSMVLASLIYLMFLLVIIARQPVLLLLASAIVGVAAAILWTAEGAYVVKSSDKRNYGRNAGLVISALFLGSFIGIISASFFH
jgi:MFS family permease